MMQLFPPCVHCGECCKAAPCAHGRRDHGQCLFLVPYEEDGLQLYACGIYDQIIKQPDADLMPAFGGGCCRTLFNPVRNEIIKRKGA